MTLITKIPGVVFTDATLPILYKDASINSGTLFAYDIHPSSYLLQSAPANGTPWNDLTYNSNNASFTIATANSIGFSNGFTFNPDASGNYLTLPASGKAAANQDGYLFILWIKPTGVSANSSAAIAGCAQSTIVSQWVIDNGSADSGSYRITGPPLIRYSFTPTINAVYQIAIAVKLVTGIYQMTVYINGAQVYTASTGLTTLPQPTTLNPIIGPVTGFTDGAKFTLYRILGYNTSVFADMAAVTTQVAADYAANIGRFS